MCFLGQALPHPGTTEAIAITNTRTATTTTHKTVPVPLPPPIPSPTPPPTLWLGPWPAVGRKPLNPARGPRGPYWPWLCRTASPSPKEKGACPPYRRPCDHTAFYSVFCVSHFFDLVAQDGSTWPNIGPKKRPSWANIAPRSANIAPRWANIAPKLGQLAPKMGQPSPKMVQVGPTYLQDRPT